MASQVIVGWTMASATPISAAIIASRRWRIPCPVSDRRASCRATASSISQTSLSLVQRLQQSVQFAMQERSDSAGGPAWRHIVAERRYMLVAWFMLTGHPDDFDHPEPCPGSYEPGPEQY
jgi:hypothetical protein